MKICLDPCKQSLRLKMVIVVLLKELNYTCTYELLVDNKLLTKLYPQSEISFLRRVK